MRRAGKFRIGLFVVALALFLYNYSTGRRFQTCEERGGERMEGGGCIFAAKPDRGAAAGVGE